MSDDRPSSEGPPPRHARNHLAAWLDLSHELRTPTHAILGHVDLLLDGSAGPLSLELRAGIGEIQRAAMTLSTRLSEAIRLAENLSAPDVETTSAEPVDDQR